MGAALLYAVALSTVLLGGLTIGERLLHDRAFALVAWLGLALNPLLLSTIGLESALYAALLVAALASLIAERWRWLGVSLGLLILTRPDGALFALLVGFELLRRGQLRWATPAIAAAIALPWYAGSWVFLGSLVPDTLLIKAGRLWEEGYSFRDGVARYLQVYPTETLASLLLTPLALAAPFLVPPKARSIAWLLVGYAAIHYAAYSALRVGPYHWYYLQQVVPLVLLATMSICSLRARLTARLARSLTAVTVAGLVTGALLITRPLPLVEPLVTSNWATAAEYRAIAAWLNQQGTSPIRVDGEIGTLAFYSDRLLIDLFTDYATASQAIFERAQGRSGVQGLLLRLNLHWRPRNGAPALSPLLTLEGTNKVDEPDPPGTVMAWLTGTHWFPPRRYRLVDRALVPEHIVMDRTAAGGSRVRLAGQALLGESSHLQELRFGPRQANQLQAHG